MYAVIIDHLEKGLLELFRRNLAFQQPWFLSNDKIFKHFIADSFSSLKASCSARNVTRYYCTNQTACISIHKKYTARAEIACTYHVRILCTLSCTYLMYFIMSLCTHQQPNNFEIDVAHMSINYISSRCTYIQQKQRHNSVLFFRGLATSGRGLSRGVGRRWSPPGGLSIRRPPKVVRSVLDPLPHR